MDVKSKRCAMDFISYCEAVLTYLTQVVVA